METERIILCGGVKPSGGTGAAPVLALNLWEKVGATNVWLEIEHLHEKLWRNVPAKFQDLLEIAAYVYSCDASTRRGQREVDTFGAHWQRRLNFHIPVREPAFWASAEAQAALRGTLEFLSDDYYDFTFYGAKGATEVQQFFKLETGDGPLNRPERVALFSGGLDSLAGAVEDGCGEQRKLLLVNHRSTDKFCRRHEALTQALLEKVRPVPMSQVRVVINKSAKLGTDYTQRARSFLYASMGATVARMMELDELTFFENGVVSLNLPVCAQVAGGRSTRTTHPRVIRGMERLLTLVGDGKLFRLRTPFLWDTKAEVVKRILKHGAGPLIGMSRSCAETIARSNDQPHCGVCSQCIDRRVGVIAAGAEAFDPEAGYAVDVFTESLPKDAAKIMAASYVERANEVGRFRTAAQFVGAFPEVLRALRHMEGEPTGLAGRVLQLYQRHAREVTAALDAMVVRHAKALRERTLAADCLLRIMMDANSVEVVPAVPKNGEKSQNGGNGAGGAERIGGRPAGEVLEDIHREIASVRKDFHEMRTVKERLEQMQGEKLFAFIDGIDPESFRVLCSVLANGDVAKASRALNLSDSTLRSKMADWQKRGPAYKVLLELVRWRKAIGRKGTVPLNESITRGTAAKTDFEGLLADVLDGLLSMTETNWQELCEELAQMLRPHVTT